MLKKLARKYRVWNAYRLIGNEFSHLKSIHIQSRQAAAQAIHTQKTAKNYEEVIDDLNDELETYISDLSIQVLDYDHVFSRLEIMFDLIQCFYMQAEVCDLMLECVEIFYKEIKEFSDGTKIYYGSNSLEALEKIESETMNLMEKSFHSGLNKVPENLHDYFYEAIQTTKNDFLERTKNYSQYKDHFKNKLNAGSTNKLSQQRFKLVLKHYSIIEPKVERAINLLNKIEKTYTPA